MDTIEEKYRLMCNTPSDIHEHLPTIYNYASKCDSVFETGIRGCVSSWGFLYGLLNNNNNKKKTYFLNDINECDIDDLLNFSKGLNIEITYEWKNNLLLDFNTTYDITFIDTWHVYAQLKRELEKFSKITNKYIIMHDTTVDEIDGETVRDPYSHDAEKESKESGFPIDEIKKGLGPAIYEFLDTNREWYILERYSNNNGLTILGRRYY